MEVKNADGKIAKNDLEEKLFMDTGGGCSVCGNIPVVNVGGTYWLCGSCVYDRMPKMEDLDIPGFLRKDYAHFAGLPTEPNAHLIAAAPDLLECCKRALNESARVHPDFMAQLESAIAKAGAA